MLQMLNLTWGFVGRSMRDWEHQLTLVSNFQGTLATCTLPLRAWPSLAMEPLPT
jgi:hypothetical protein